MHPKREITQAFYDADAAWEALLPKVRDARYMKMGRGDVGTPLRAAYEARERARQSWEATTGMKAD